MYSQDQADTLTKVTLFDKISLLAFISSLPLLLPVLDTIYWIAGRDATDTSLLLAPHTPFLWTMYLSAMFTALALLFICLFKTAYFSLGTKLIRIGGASYLLGYAVLLGSVWTSSNSLILFSAAGIPLGFGVAVISMAWASRARVYELHKVFIALLIAIFASSAIGLGFLFVPPTIAITCLFVFACLGIVGAVSNQENTQMLTRSKKAEANWWDVFGKMDVSLVEGVDDYEAPASRILFFVVTPLVMLLLFVVNRSISFDHLPYTSAMLGCLVVLPLSLPLLLITSSKGLINAACRLYLPLLAFCVFVVKSFVEDGIGAMVLSLGIDTFCILYALLIASMIATMASHMRSLILPSTSLVIIGLSLVELLSYTEVNAGALTPFKPFALMILFVLSVALLLATPSSRMWHVILVGVTQSKDASPSFFERCTALAEKYHLTAREAEILSYLGRGYSASYVAELLVVAESTIRSHRKNIYRKLDVSSREELLDLIDNPEN